MAAPSAGERKVVPEILLGLAAILVTAKLGVRPLPESDNRQSSESCSPGSES